jgi:rare lipoprotein A (peptidoglycan hydrolase)
MKSCFVFGLSVAAIMVCGGAMADQVFVQAAPDAGEKTGLSALSTDRLAAETVARIAAVTKDITQLASSALVEPPADTGTAIASLKAADASAAKHRGKDKLASKLEKQTSRHERLAAADLSKLCLRVVGRVETGTAAWYGERYVGRRTSSGERLDAIHATAAHRTLPLNSLARVTNLRNGRSVVVRVTDRGPLSDELLIDMSPRAAEDLNMRQAGLVPVRVEQVVEVPSDTK